MDELQKDDGEEGSVQSSRHVEPESRDEVKEIEKFSRKDTLRLRLVRAIVTLAILIAAFAVTRTTYSSISREEVRIFETSFLQFARTVGDAALQQQYDIRNAYKSLADIITSTAITADATWPYYQLPAFEKFAENVLIQSRSEFVAYRPAVTREQVDSWLEFINEDHIKWMRESHMIRYGTLKLLNETGYKPYLTRFHNKSIVKEIERDLYYPTAIVAPPLFNYRILNLNIGSIEVYNVAMKVAGALRNATISTPVVPFKNIVMSKEEHAKLHSKLPPGEVDHPHSYFFTPVFDDYDTETSKVVAFLSSCVAWDRSLQNLLPDNVEGIVVEISNNCNQTYTYQIDGKVAEFLGTGSLHNSKYDYLEQVISLTLNPEYANIKGHCQFSLHIFPGEKFEAAYHSNTPLVNSILVGSTFILIALTFAIYDTIVQIRNRKLVANAAQSGAIVSQLFPGKIRDKVILQQRKQLSIRKTLGDGSSALLDEDIDDNSKPMADLFLECSLIFADISGFTAWSSVREPHQVFQLLETIFGTFDKIARYHGVFKVETVGDCYVAATGLPEVRRDYPVTMARFAQDIMQCMKPVTSRLELTLGPDTGDLTLRIGIHCGPITAGVLRGDRARFQLFGDTINTTSRLQTTSEVGKIHVSSEFARVLKMAGKGKWLTKRDKTVQAKGKGDLETYWLSTKNDSKAKSFGIYWTDTETLEGTEERFTRLIDWNVETLGKFLCHVMTKRTSKRSSNQRSFLDKKARMYGSDFLSEVKEIIALPEFNANVSLTHGSESDLPPIVQSELRVYVTGIANLYRRNDFHNFEHVSHVLMSVTKLMSRIVAPTDKEFDCESSLHDHTYGITSDPLTQFSCALSALIHDVDHVGVPNTQLVKENASIASKFKLQSVAEQNSIDLSWNLLMESQFSNLRAAIYTNEAELERFRELLVNGVMATDIADKYLKGLRNARWEKAFRSDGAVSDSNTRDAINRKATIVIEHLIQASDVCHTMQHWHIYRRWNERLFYENSKAFKDGRANNDPAESWYEGEIGFFDSYIIPLAKKLKDCGVFGLSSGEFLAYAIQNRNEWEQRGREIVKKMVEDRNNGSRENKVKND